MIRVAQEEDTEEEVNYIAERTFFTYEKWQEVRPPQKIPRSRGLFNGDNVYVIQTDEDAESVNGFSPYIGVVVDANLKKGVIWYLRILTYILMHFTMYPYALLSFSCCLYYRLSVVL